MIFNQYELHMMYAKVAGKQLARCNSVHWYWYGTNLLGTIIDNKNNFVLQTVDDILLSFFIL